MQQILFVSKQVLQMCKDIKFGGFIYMKKVSYTHTHTVLTRVFQKRKRK